jgi:hypothetical protein
MLLRYVVPAGSQHEDGVQPEAGAGVLLLFAGTLLVEDPRRTEKLVPVGEEILLNL